MIKSITASPIGRKFIATTMLSTALVAGNIATLTAKNDKTSTQTEIISKDGAKAIKTNTTKVKTEPVEHNKKLDKIYLKNCNLDETIKNKKDHINTIYNTFGMFGGTIELQREVDDHFIKESLNTYIEHFAIFSSQNTTAKKITKSFYEWRDKEFYNELWQKEQKMYEDKKYPSAEDAISVIDEHIFNTNFFTKEDKETYKKGSEIYLSHQKEKTSDAAKSDLLAYKVHLLNAIGFRNFLINNNNMPDNHILMYYLNYNFLNSEGKVKP